MVRPALAEVNLPDSGWRVFQVRYLEPRNQGAISLTSELEQVVENRQRIYRSERFGQPVYVVERRERTREGDEFEWTFVLDPRELDLFWAEKNTSTRSGQQVAGSWTNYRNPMNNYPQKLCHIYTLAYFLQTLDLHPGARYDLYLQLALDATPWHMFVLVTGKETVSVPAGKFDCYKLKLEPDYKAILGKWSWAARVLEPFVPDFFFWLEEAPPHALVRFEGKFGPVGAAPTQAHELVEVKPVEEKPGP